MCGGGGSSVTQTYDPAYNQGMLELARENQAMANEMYNMFKYGVTYNPEETVRGAYIDGKWVDEADLPRVSQSTGQGRYEYYNTRTGERITDPSQYMGRGADSWDGSSYIEKRWVEPGSQDVIDPSIKIVEKRLGEIKGYDPTAQTSEMQYLQNIIGANQELLRPRTELEKAQLAAEQRLIGPASQFAEEQIQSQRELLPISTEYQKTSLLDKTKGIQERAPIRTELYQSALEDDAARRQTQAQADVQHAFDNTQGQFERRMFMSGISPNSSAYTMATNERNLAKAKAIAGARTLARDKAKMDRFSRLRTAMSMI